MQSTIKTTVCVAVIAMFLCNTCYFIEKDKGQLLAEVGEEALYEADLSQIYPLNATQADSIELRKNYIQTWVKNRVMVQLAEKNLTALQKDVTRQLEDYRNSLLVYKYEQRYIAQQLNTEITEEEYKEFYNQNKQNFLLQSPILKGVFIKIDKATVYLKQVAALYASENEEDMTTLKNLCLRVALKFDTFNDQWVTLSQLEKDLPYGYPYETMLERSRQIEVTDNQYAYFVFVKYYRRRGDISSLENEKENIKKLILTGRKVNLIKELEELTIKEALQSDNAKVYYEQE
jgi:hypothetical protein